jgi:hypothetical protein
MTELPPPTPTQRHRNGRPLSFRPRLDHNKHSLDARTRARCERHRLGRVQADLAELRYFEEILAVREGGTRASDAPVRPSSAARHASPGRAA